MVLVEHASGIYNLYLSDITGVYFSLSLPDIVVEGSFIDLELVSYSKKKWKVLNVNYYEIHIVLSRLKG